MCGDGSTRSLVSSGVGEVGVVVVGWLVGRWFGTTVWRMDRYVWWWLWWRVDWVKCAVVKSGGGGLS